MFVIVDSKNQSLKNYAKKNSKKIKLVTENETN